MIKFCFIVILILNFIPKVKNDTAKYSLISCFLLFLIIGLRDEMVILDTSNYVRQFTALSGCDFQAVLADHPKDPFFWIYSKCVFDISGGQYTIWLLCCALVYVSAIYRILSKYSDDILISILVYFVLGFFYFSLTGIRQNLAFACVLLSFPYLKDRKLIKFILLIVAAALFHKTAIVFLLAYPASSIKFKNTIFVLYLVAMVLAITVGASFFDFLSTLSLDARLDGYYEDSKTLNYSGLILQCGIVGVSYLLLSNKKNEQDISLLLHLGLLGIVFRAFSGHIAEAFRISMYFSFFDMLLLSKAIINIKKEERPIIQFLVCVVFLIYIVTSPNTGFNINYHFFWEEVTHVIE